MREFLQAKALIKSRFVLEGIHNFPIVEEKFPAGIGSVMDVSFLKYPHRHNFIFDVYIEVKHDDRDVEFIQLARQLKAYMASQYSSPNHLAPCDFGVQSCEMLAREIILNMKRLTGYEGFIKVEVSEDGENSAIIEGHL